MSKKIITQLLKKYQTKINKCNILCIGDIILDQYIYTIVERISPEAPVPILIPMNEKFQLGGVGNVAKNITSMGAKATIVYLNGSDNSSKKIDQIISNEKNLTNIKIKNKKFITPRKTRYLHKLDHIIRIDNEDLKFRLSKKDKDTVLLKIKKYLKDADLVILSDYSKGLLDKQLISMIVKLAKDHNKIIITDPKKDDFSIYKGMDIITPNQKEITDSCNKKVLNDDQLLSYSKYIIKKYKINNILVTQSENGMLLVNSRNHYKYKSFARKIIDVTGAGDTVISILGLMIASGMSIRDAILISNYAASITISKKGTANTHIKEMINWK